MYGNPFSFPGNVLVIFLNNARLFWNYWRKRSNLYKKNRNTAQQCYSFKRHSAMLLIQKAFSNATHSKASSDGSLLNTLKLNLTSRRFDCDNFKKLEQLHKKNTTKVKCVQHKKEWLDLSSLWGEKENYSSNKMIFAFFPQNYTVFKSHENINSNSK